MSRIGKKPVPVPAGVKVAVTGHTVQVEGPKGKLRWDFHPAMTVRVEGSQIVVSRPDDQRQNRALHGLTRALIANMCLGVTQGYQRRLEIVGVGYNAKVQGSQLLLTVGYANTIAKKIPDGVTVELPNPTHIVIRGADKRDVGQFAAEVRKVQPPEPYQGKGIRFEGEQIRRKVGKAFGATTT
jgi:large subunit ribosomal protein L6